MKPKNKKERTNSILKFAILFLISTALIVLTFFFDFNRIPLKENKVLREKSNYIERELVHQKKFSKNVEEVISLMDSLKVEGINLEYTDALINNKIVDLEKLIPAEDSTYRYKMYKNIVKSYVDLQALNVKIRSFKDVDTKLVKYETEIERLSSKLEKCQRNLSALRRR